MSDDDFKPTEGMLDISLEGKGSANLVYILYFLGLFLGVTALVGVILAYVNKGKYGEGLDSHFQFQIRSFWFGLLFMIVGAVLMVVLIGWLVWLAAAIWLIARLVTGMQALNAGKALSDPETLGFMAK